MDYKGKHVLCDVILENNLSNEELERIIEEGISHSKMTVVKKVSVPFEPHGLTAVWILSESHFTVHTYPESNYVSMDCYTCGDEGSPKGAMDHIVETLKPVKADIKFLLRGTV